MNTLMINFYNALANVADHIQPFNDGLMYSLSGFEVLLVLIYLGLYQPQDGVRKFVIVTLVVIVFNGLLAMSPQLINGAFNGTIELGLTATGYTDASPTSIFESGLDFINKLVSLGIGSGWQWFANALFWFLMVVTVLFVYTLIAADYFIIYVRFYVYSLLSGTMIALGVFKPTREIFYNFLKGMMGLLFYLFVFMVFLSIFSEASKNWGDYINAVTDNKPVAGKGEFSDIKDSCYKTTLSGDLIKDISRERCNEYFNAIDKNNEQANDFFSKHGIEVIVTLILIFVTMKSVVPWFASIVGFGSYDTRGGGIVGQIANITSRAIDNSFTRKAIETAGGTKGAQMGLGAAKGAAGSLMQLGNPLQGAIQGARNAGVMHDAAKIGQENIVKQAMSTIAKAQQSTQAPKPPRYY